MTPTTILATCSAPARGARPEAGERRPIDTLLPVIYEELRALAVHHLRGQRHNSTLSPTVLVHEAYVRLAEAGDVQWRSRAHFFAVAATVIRRVLLRHVRRRCSVKRGGAWRQVALRDDDMVFDGNVVDLIALDDALTRLGRLAPQKLRVIELRFFAGLSIDEIAEALGVSSRTVARDWRFARAWLRTAIEDGRL